MLQRIAFFGVVCFWLSAAGAGFCQSGGASGKSYRVPFDTADRIATQRLSKTGTGSLPDAPSARLSTQGIPSQRTSIQRNAFGAMGVRTQLPLKIGGVALYPGSARATDTSFLAGGPPPAAAAFDTPGRERVQEQKEPNFILSKYLYRSMLPQNLPQQSTSDRLIGRATDAAARVLVPRDETGKRRLNTPYLARVLTMVVAHVASRPSWRRTGSEPVSDFASTVGNDAGMNVLHEFEPGLKQILTSHTPRFVSGIEARLLRSSSSHR
jgi:hypothetical protein